MRTTFSPGAGLMALAGLVALIAGILADTRMMSGISHSAGALLVILSSAAILVAALLLCLTAVARSWGRPLLLVLLALGILGTALAAWFLEATVILLAMLVAAIGWIVALAWQPRPRTDGRTGGVPA